MMTSRSTMAAGIRVSWLLTCGNREWKIDNLSLDKASARVFWIPGICSATTEICHLALVKARHLIRCIASLLWLFPLLRIFTVAMLSDRKRTVWPFQFVPHTAPAIIIGVSSLTVIWEEHRFLPLGSWNHSLSDRALHPQLPDASAVITPTGGVFWGQTTWKYHSMTR